MVSDYFRTSGRVSRPFLDLKEVLWTTCKLAEGCPDHFMTSGLSTSSGLPGASPDHFWISGRVSRPVPQHWDSLQSLLGLREGLPTS